MAFPGDADIDQNKISVLAPIGTAMLGYRVGGTLEWEVPAGLRRLKVKAILYQPEAAGDDEAEIINFMPPGKEKWLDTMERLAKLQTVPDDYGYP